MSGLQKELRPKGFEVLEAAVNEDADIPAFVKQFNPSFPVGIANAFTALEYLQWPRTQRPLVPFIVFIDPQGVIRAQYTGADAQFFDEQQDQHIRAEIWKLLGQTNAPAKSKSKHAER